MIGGGVMIMKKSKLNLIIDALLLLCIAAIAGIGFLIKYVLVPGFQRWEIYNRNVDLSYWGIDRHEWGSIHFTIALTFLVLLIIHIVLHWPVIINIYCKLIPNSLVRRVIAVIIICLVILLVIFPLFVEPEVQERGPGNIRGWLQREVPTYNNRQ